MSAFLSYTLSRFAFVGTHIVFLYWVNFLLNDPFNLGTNTLDAKQVKPKDQCTPLIYDNLVHDLLLFGLWWGTHSTFARKAYKTAVGLWQHPLERPLFATIATIAWGINVLYWRPVTDCEKWNPFDIPSHIWGVSGSVIVLGALLIVGFLWYLPDHVFGTSKYLYKQGESPKGHGIIKGFPYGLVRHPAASGFLWIYWSLPAYTTNHLFLATLWTIFIVVGTLIFEEGGLRGTDEFGKQYEQYRKEVSAFYPNPGALSAFFTSSPKKHE